MCNVPDTNRFLCSVFLVLCVGELNMIDSGHGAENNNSNIYTNKETKTNKDLGLSTITMKLSSFFFFTPTHKHGK